MKISANDGLRNDEQWNGTRIDLLVTYAEGHKPAGLPDHPPLPEGGRGERRCCGMIS